MNTHAPVTEIKPDPLPPPLPKIEISKYAQALIKNYIDGTPKVPPHNTPKISVSQTVSFAAFLYEKLRNAIEYREDHLVRRASIDRIIKRRLLLNPNGTDIAEPLIKEMLWARYLENNTIPEDKIIEIQTTIDKYIYLRNQYAMGRPSQEQQRISTWMTDILACEIEEKLSPNLQREAFVNYVYQMLRPKVELFEDAQSRDVQVYIASERSYAKSDDPLIRYHLLKLLAPELVSGSWQDAQVLLPKFHEIYQKIESDIAHPLREPLRRFVKKQIPPFYILRDIFEQFPAELEKIMTTEEQLVFKVDEMCRKRYQETRVKLQRAGVRSFIYIVLTKVLVALALEVPYDLYIAHHIAYLPIGINILFPPIFMSIIILSVNVPGADNTKRIQTRIKQILIEDPDNHASLQDQITIGRKVKVKSPMMTIGFTILYLLGFYLSFGFIIYVLSRLHFSAVSQGIFLLFLTMVTFFAYRIRQIAREYLILNKDRVVSPIVDFFMLPLLRVGQWLSGEIAKINIIIFLFDFVIEGPFKAVFEVVEEWIHFVRLKKEEMI